jgi:hypothetical protein
MTSSIFLFDFCSLPFRRRELIVAKRKHNASVAASRPPALAMGSPDPATNHRQAALDAATRRLRANQNAKCKQQN